MASSSPSTDAIFFPIVPYTALSTSRLSSGHFLIGHCRMETFPIIKRRDEQRHGEYRTKRVIVEIYDEWAMQTGRPYQT